MLSHGVLNTYHQSKLNQDQKNNEKTNQVPQDVKTVDLARMPELPKRRDSVSSSGSITGYNIRSNLKSAFLGLFGKAAGGNADCADPSCQKPHDTNMSPYADHNINHGALYTPDGSEIDPKAMFEKN